MSTNNKIDSKLETGYVKAMTAIKVPRKEFRDLLKYAVQYGADCIINKHSLYISEAYKKKIADVYVTRFTKQPENLWEWKPLESPEIETYYFYSLDPSKTETEILLWNGLQISMNVSSRFAFEVILAKDISKILQTQIKNYKVNNLIVTNAPPGTLVQKKYLPKFALYAFINVQVEDGEIKHMENLEWKRQD